MKKCIIDLVKVENVVKSGTDLGIDKVASFGIGQP